jgi:hypothetical protein
MSTALEINAEQDNKIFNRMFKSMRFSTSIWTGQRRIAAIEATMSGQRLDQSRVGRPPASLLPPHLVKLATMARSKFYRVLDENTFPCDNKGVRLLPVANMAKTVAEIQAAAAGIEDVGRTIAGCHTEIHAYNRDYWRLRCARYADAEAATRLGQLQNRLAQLESTWLIQRGEQVALVAEIAAIQATRDEAATESSYQSTVARLIPTVEQLRASYSASWELATPDADRQRFESPLVQAFYDEAAENMKQKAQELIQAVVSQPVELMTVKLQELKEKIVTSDHLRPSAFNEAQLAIQQCLNMADALSPEMRQLVSSVQVKLRDVTYAAERNKHTTGYTETVKRAHGALTTTFDAAIEAATQKLGQAELLSKFGVIPRKLRLLDDVEFD